MEITIDSARGGLSRRSLLRGAAAAAAAWGIPGRSQSTSRITVYVGCYTARGRGIYIYQMDTSSGVLELMNVVTGETNPSFLALDPHRRFLYAVNEIGNYEGRRSGAVSAFAVNEATGSLTFLNRQPSEGQNPAHISVDPTGRYVLVANYSGGNLAALPIESDGKLKPPSDVVNHTGPLGPNTARQEAPHAHMILPDPFGRFVLANDLGLDKTFIYRLDQESGKLPANEPAFAIAEPGGGPRHLAFHQTGRYVYVLNELNSTLAAFAYDGARGALQHIQTLRTLPDWYQGINTTAQVVVAPSGRFIYASNRGNDTIAIFAINPDTGMMTPVGHQWTRGETPRNFNIDPTGNWMLVGHQNTDNIVVFRIDQSTGELTYVGPMTTAGQPVCLVFSTPPPAGNTARPGVTFWANPNPVHITDRNGLGQVTLSWNAPGTKTLEIRIGAPDGVTMGRLNPYGSTTTGYWVTDGMTFYLQDVSDGNPLTAANTLGMARVQVHRPMPVRA